MRRILILFVAVLPLAMSSSDRSSDDRCAAPASQERYSPERLEKIRQTLAAQMAVFDEAENALRAATPAESARLFGNIDLPRESIAVPGGGVALRAAPSDLSLLVATIGDNGSIQVTHGDAPATPAKPVVKGGRDVR